MKGPHGELPGSSNLVVSVGDESLQIVVGFVWKTFTTCWKQSLISICPSIPQDMAQLYIPYLLISNLKTCSLEGSSWEEGYHGRTNRQVRKELIRKIMNHSISDGGNIFKHTVEIAHSVKGLCSKCQKIYI